MYSSWLKERQLELVWTRQKVDTTLCELLRTTFPKTKTTYSCTAPGSRLISMDATVQMLLAFARVCVTSEYIPQIEGLRKLQLFLSLCSRQITEGKGGRQSTIFHPVSDHTIHTNQSTLQTPWDRQVLHSGERNGAMLQGEEPGVFSTII